MAIRALMVTKDGDDPAKVEVTEIGEEQLPEADVTARKAAFSR